MTVELAYVTALPRSVRAADHVHVSAFITPRLTPDAGAAHPVLGDFALFPDWGSIVGSQRVSVRVHDQNGPMDCAVVSAPPDGALWSTAFPRDLAVAANAVPDWSGRPQGSFSVPLVSAVAKTLQWMTAAAAPGDTPLPSAHPLAPVFQGLIERFQRYDGRDRHVDARHFDEAAYLAMLDEVSRDRRLRGLTPGLRAGAASFGAAVGAQSDVTAFAGVAILGLHQARRFYDRPEANTVTSGSPKHSDAPPKHLDPPRAEFHRRVSAAGDHPELLRRLGLLLDIEADPVRLATSAWIAVEVLVDGTTQSTRSVRTAVRALPDGTLVAAAAADGRADTDAADGVVLLGDPARFTVADVDPDGSALKMDRYLGNFPRMMALERNGDDVTAATPALRTQGLVVARQERSDRARTAVDVQRELEGRLRIATPVSQSPLVSADAITRGIRIEVWDDSVKRWHSLHRRLSTLRVEGMAGTVYDDLPNEGALQGTPAQETPGAPATSPVYIHETAFGWDGWSLSAPRPGRRLVARDEPDDDTPTGWRQHEDPVEPSDEPLPGETPPDPFRLTHRIAPGTLPRLRFGRSYAFRAWTVDLGGHSRPHELNPAPPPPQAIAQLAADHGLSAVLDRQRLLSTLSVADDVAAGALDAAKASISAARERLRQLPFGARVVDLAAVRAAARGTAGADPESAVLDRLVDVAGHVARRRRVDEPVEGAAPDTAATALLDAAGIDATSEVGAPLGSAALWRAVESAERLPVLSTAVRDLDAVAALVASHAATLPGTPTPAATLQSVTPLTPFLRWDPVPPPVVVPRTRYTEGESLRTVVIRSKVVFAADSDVPEITAPADFADELATAAGQPDAGAAGYREFGERHLVPPKATHDHAELHGQFDRALDAEGAEQDAARKDVLAWSRLESGTLFDRDILDVTDPEGPTIAQDAQLLADPAAKGPLKTLPFDRPGEGPASGQYLAIDQDALTLPYLPDPLADGVSLRFTDAAPQRLLPNGRPSEGFTARYAGPWPSKNPWLLRVGTGAALSTELAGTVLGITLPPGESLKLRLSSSIVRDKLDELGPWRLLSSGGDIPLLREEAVDGRLWTCSPSEAVVLVHATTRPMERPRLVGGARVLRAPGATDGFLLAALDLHGPSTESLTAELAWTDHVDDLGYDAPQERPRAQIGFTTPVAPFEDTALLAGGSVPLYVPELGLIAQHSTRHVFDDTKHHEVTYRLRATTRYREYFPPAALASDGSPGDDGRSVLGEPFTLHVPSSARPPQPVVHSVLPLMRWERRTEPHQPAAWRHTRLSGVRVYLERPWNESGDGELLGVLLAPAGTPDTDVDGDRYYSQWGADPIWPAGGVATRMLSALQLDSLLHAFDLDDRTRPGRPVTAVVDLPPRGPDTFAGASRRAPYQAAAVVGYRPQYNPARRLWYVDIAFDLSTEFWPFVRLSLARYQPHSLPGFELSEAVRADFVQLTPPRETSASRTDERHVRVLTSGPQSFRVADAERGGAPAADPVSAPWMSGGVSPSALPALAGRLLVARLQRRDPDIGGDLGWTTVHTQEMVPLGLSLVPSGPTWGAELDAGEDVDLRTPRDEPSQWRVTVEEWERFPGDPPPDSTARFPQPPVWEQRLVYADEFAL